jgi:hypothetical protein
LSPHWTKPEQQADANQAKGNDIHICPKGRIRRRMEESPQARDDQGSNDLDAKQKQQKTTDLM